MPQGRTTLRARCALAVLTVAATGAVTAIAPVAHAVEAPADTAPTVTLAVDRTLVNVTREPAVVGVTATVTTAAGAPGTSAVAVRVGEAAAPARLYRVSGTAASGTWSGVATVPAVTPHGALAAYVDVTDAAGTTAAVATAVTVTVPDAPPAAPAGLVVHAVDLNPAGLRVAWSAPAATGGSPVESYEVSAAPVPGSDPAALAGHAGVLGADVRELTFAVSPGTRYVVRVAARNAAGTGPAAVTDAVNDAAAVHVPDGPTAVVARPGDRALRISWTPSASDGGSPLQRYDVRARPRNTALRTPPAVSVTTPTALVTGLVNGATYDVSVVAANAIGDSLPGTAAAAPRRAPGVPVLGTTSAGDRHVVVRWSPPATTGGAPIHSYTVTSAAGVHAVLPATARSFTVRGLTNGTRVAFGVAAANVAGTGTRAITPGVVPHRDGRLTVVSQPSSPVVYGRASVVGAALTVNGAGVSGQRVQLMAQVRPSTSWRRVAEGLTDSNGRVRLSAVLPATSQLRLHHPLSSVAAPDVSVRGVYVATRVTAAPSATNIRLGQTLVVRGGVAPAHPVGSSVRLQRYSSGEWRTVAYGQMTTSTAYRVSWRPGSLGTSLLRVVKPAHTDHTTGVSGRWSQTVDPEATAEVAGDILNDGGIRLATSHLSGIYDLATARQNVLDVAAGRLARRSSYENAPGGYTTIDLRLLKALRRMGTLGTVHVTEIAGGSHSRGSTHYYGRGLDINYVNGRHVAPGSGYSMAVEACRAFGAVRVFHPGYDPYGGHQGHVHCDWA